MVLYSDYRVLQPILKKQLKNGKTDSNILPLYIFDNYSVNLPISSAHFTISSFFQL